MNDVYSIILFMILIPVLILLTIAVTLMKGEMDDLKEEIAQHQMKLKQLDFCNISDYEERLDQLEEALELKEYYDDTSQNKK